MSFQKFKSNSYCVGGRHRSSTIKFYGDITSKGSEVSFVYCSSCNRKKSMRVPDNTIQAECLGDFFKFLGKIGLNVSKKMAKNVLTNPGRALENRANGGRVFACRNPKAALSSLLEPITFYHTGRGFYLGKTVPAYTI